LTRDCTYRAAANVERANDLATALERCRLAGETVVFIIGGGEIYRQALPLADRLYLTWVHRDVAGETRFPEYDGGEWVETGREDHEGYSFVNYTRVKC
jgi:dihydrofolate reductase